MYNNKTKIDVYLTKEILTFISTSKGEVHILLHIIYRQIKE